VVYVLVVKEGCLMETSKHRPLGVTIIAVLNVIAGIIAIAVGIPALIVVVGVVFIAVGIASLVMAYGLWKGRSWAWTITLILSGIGIIVGIAHLVARQTGAIVEIIIYAIIIYYLYRPNVKAFFGK
jgi:uncharacterized membrane protein HdeD (DUF308 family)